MDAVPPRESTVTRGTTLLIHRLLALFCPANLVPALALMRHQLPQYATWWLVLLLPWGAASLAVMLVQAARRRPISRAAGSYALFALAAVATSPLAAGTASAGAQPWLWWVAGPAIVCAAIWRGLPAAVGHAVLLAGCWGVVTTLPQVGTLPRTAWSDAAGLVVMSLAVAVTALEMLRAGEAADTQARRLYADQLEHALSRTLAVERAQLDRLIHDDVMTTLTSAAHARDAATTAATRQLARATLAKISALEQHQLPPGGRLEVAALLRLVARTSEHISPSVSFVNRVPDDVAAEVGIPVAEALVGAVREAARNAVRHAWANTIEVTAELRTDPDRGDLLALTVRDDGVGFDVDQVTGSRFGVHHSIVERLRLAGVDHAVDSAHLAGTRVVMVTPLQARRPSVAVVGPSDEPVEELPAAFPTRQLLAVFWLAIGGQVVLGLVNHQVTRLGPNLAAMAVLVGAAALVVHGRSGLQLPRRRAVAVVVLLAAGVSLGVLAMPRDRWPDEAFWFFYPLELMLVVLVVRMRLPYAVIAWALTGVAMTVWCLGSGFGWTGISTCVFGTTSFVAMAVAVRRVLGTIARRQHDLHRREVAALDSTVRRYVARIQRALWVEDLQESVRDVLRTIAGSPQVIGDRLREDCLLVEAKLRESLVARNVMTEELAATTEAARRTGVEVVFVDSRESEVNREVSRAVLREVRAAVADPTARRVVVRLAPNGMPLSATVFTLGASGSSLTSISTDGASTSEKLSRG